VLIVCNTEGRLSELFHAVLCAQNLLSDMSRSCWWTEVLFVYMRCYV